LKALKWPRLSRKRSGFVKHFPGVDHEKGYPMKWDRKKNEMIKDFEDYSMAHKTFTLGYLLERKCYKLIKGRLDDLKMIIFF
jgi:hypothetical protein